MTPAPNQAASTPTILIVDDEAVIRDLCATALAGYRTLQAEDGSDALEVLGREPVDLVLTDVMMPVMNGLDLLTGIKQRDPTQLVVMMTGFGDKEVILRALKADADEFIQKPINLLQLKTVIGKVLERKALQEELLELKRLDRLKSEFLGLISHKLKTPITVISLFIQNLERELGPGTEPEYRQNLELILEESNHLNDLVQSLLQFSSIILRNQPGAPTLFNPAEPIANCLIEIKCQADRGGVKLVYDLPEDLPLVRGDSLRLQFALRAVLDNAIKFTPSGGRVEVTAAATAEAVTICVSDTGCGIPNEEQSKVFEKFYQVDPDRTGQVRGFGLGLFYAREIVQEHAGSLTLQSQPGHGTRVAIRLPRP